MEYRNRWRIQELTIDFFFFMFRYSWKYCQGINYENLRNICGAPNDVVSDGGRKNEDTQS